MKLFRLLSLLFLCLTMPSCAVDDWNSLSQELLNGINTDSNGNVYWGNNVSKATFFTYLRLMTEEGENVLDIAGREQWHLSSDHHKLLLTNFTVTRKSDGAEMTLEPEPFYCSETIEGEDFFSSDDFPMLRVVWIDMDLRSGKNRPVSYMEKYDVKLTLTRNGYDDVHHVLVTVRVEGQSYALNSNYPDGSYCTAPFLATVEVDRRIYE